MDELDEVRWGAVEHRDTQMAGVFVYAVRTTGVFCRPGCAARQPRRANVEYFVTPRQAVAAGYRACRRCRPEGVAVADPAARAVIETCRQLEAPDGEHHVADLAGRFGYSERHLRRLFLGVVGVSVGAYERAQKATRARALLRGGASVTEAVFDAGFGSARAFYEHGATQLGMTPGRYRDGGRGEDIRFTSLDTPLGFALVASTSRGVCSIQLGAEEAALEARLNEEFPNAVIRRDDEGLAEVALVLAGAVRGEGDPSALPLDVAATAFQSRVWAALRTIPPGQTRTYSQVAALIGAPRAVRAVASACAANHVALAVPCHRVVRADGSLGGYRWGEDRKRSLLSVEAGRAALG